MMFTGSEVGVEMSVCAVGKQAMMLSRRHALRYENVMRPEDATGKSYVAERARPYGAPGAYQHTAACCYGARRVQPIGQSSGNRRENRRHETVYGIITAKCTSRCIAVDDIES